MLYSIESWILSVYEIGQFAAQKKECSIIHIDGSELYNPREGLSNDYLSKHRKSVALARDIGMKISENVMLDYPDLFPSIVEGSETLKDDHGLEEVIEQDGLWGN